MTRQDAIRHLRAALADLPIGAAHDAGHPPTPDQIYAPKEHLSALDPDRPIVVGNRGVGKTFWTTALTDNTARGYIAGLPVYARLRLDNVEAVAGYHGSVSDAIAPSPDLIAACEAAGVRPRKIWDAVVLRILNKRFGLGLPNDLMALGRWLEDNIEAGERALRDADSRLQEQGKRLLVIFDALDTLSPDWPVLSRRLMGLIEFARSAKGLRAIRPKLFLRMDQAACQDLWTGPDASKLFNERVRLAWSQHSLYELLFHHWCRGTTADAFECVTGRRWQSQTWTQADQRAAFTAIAGPFMGSGSKRGNTYDWLTNNLADAYGETTPRAFLKTLRAAAAIEIERDSAPPATARPDTVIDHLSIKAGARNASSERIIELQDEYWWIRLALEPLENATVPCLPDELYHRWEEAGTVGAIFQRAKEKLMLLPSVMGEPEDGSEPGFDMVCLMLSLTVIGVLEVRANGKVNMPDIFRIGARLKRRGGVKPPPRAPRAP